MSSRVPLLSYTAVAVAVVCCLLLSTSAPAVAGGDWNDGQIAWASYDEGLKQAKDSNKPVCLVIYTEWCPHCTNYSKVFHDPKVVEKSAKFVMVRLDADKNAEVNGKYVPDGKYIPRTFFLSPSGELDASIHAPRDSYKYFYSESDPASVLAGMNAALKKFN